MSWPCKVLSPKLAAHELGSFRASEEWVSGGPVVSQEEIVNLDCSRPGGLPMQNVCQVSEGGPSTHQDPPGYRHSQQANKAILNVLSSFSCYLFFLII